MNIIKITLGIVPRCSVAAFTYPVFVGLVFAWRMLIGPIGDAHNLLGADEIVRVVRVRNTTLNTSAVILDQRRGQRCIAHGQTVDTRQSRPIDGRQQIDHALDVIDAANDA